MSGGGIQYAQSMGPREMLRKSIDEDLIVVVNRLRRGMLLSQLSEEDRKKLMRRLIKIVVAIEDYKYEKDTITGIRDDVGKHLDDDTREILKAIDYLLAGDYGEEKAVEKISENLS